MLKVRYRIPEVTPSHAVIYRANRLIAKNMGIAIREIGIDLVRLIMVVRKMLQNGINLSVISGFKRIWIKRKFRE
jgi:hypothetical protein